MSWSFPFRTQARHRNVEQIRLARRRRQARRLNQRINRAIELAMEWSRPLGPDEFLNRYEVAKVGVKAAQILGVPRNHLLLVGLVPMRIGELKSLLRRAWLDDSLEVAQLPYVRDRQ